MRGFFVPCATSEGDGESNSSKRAHRGPMWGGGGGDRAGAPPKLLGWKLNRADPTQTGGCRHPPMG